MVSKASSPNEPDSTSTRERLLDAAISLAAEEGHANVTYRAVAGKAGVAHGLVRHYFGSRENLLAESLARASSMDAARSHLDAEDLDTFAEGFVAVLENEWQRALLQYEVAIAAIRGQVAIEPVRRDYDNYLRLTARTLRRCGIRDPKGSLAAVVFAALDGLALQQLIYQRPDRSERAVRQLRKVLKTLSDDS